MEEVAVEELETKEEEVEV